MPDTYHSFGGDASTPVYPSSDATVNVTSGKSSLLNHDADQTALLPPNAPGHTFKQYPQRWLILAIFSSLTITNALIWIAFAPIQQLAADYFGVSRNGINVFSMIFMGCYLPGYFLSFWAMNQRGVRWGLCLAALVQTLGAWVRYVGVVGGSELHAPHGSGYALALIGQTMAALCQPMFTNSPARLSADWFGVSQRNIATSIAAMANPLGIAVGQVLPTALVSDSGGMRSLLLVSACISTGTCILCWALLKERPPTPPSQSSYERLLAKEQALQAGVAINAPTSFWQSNLMKELRVLLSNRNFLVLTFGFGLGLGLFNAVTTLISQIVAPCGYSKDDAGTFGGLLVGCGLLGAGVMGALLDATMAYNKFLKGGLIMVMAGTIFMLLSVRPGQFALVATSFGVLGFTMLPLLPICMECAAECTYPVSEDASSGVMLTAGNIIGIIMISLFDALIQDPYRSVLNPFSITLACFLLAAVVVVGIWYDGPLLRQAAEKAGQEAPLGDKQAATMSGEASVNPRLLP